MDPVHNITPVRKPGPRGEGVYRYLFGVLASVRTKGLLRTIPVYVNRFLRAVSFRITGYALIVLKLAWMGWGFVSWRSSSLISEKRQRERKSICGACERQQVVWDGRYKTRESRYCGSCGCTHNRWSELTVKNTRERHICPLFKFPEHAKWREYVEQMKKAADGAAKNAPKKSGDCPGCKKKQPMKAADRNGHGRKLEDWHRNAGLLTAGVRGRP